MVTAAPARVHKTSYRDLGHSPRWFTNRGNPRRLALFVRGYSMAKPANDLVSAQCPFGR